MHLNGRTKESCKAANIGKAPGLDGIPAEVIKHGSDGQLQQLLSRKVH